MTGSRARGADGADYGSFFFFNIFSGYDHRLRIDEYSTLWQSALANLPKNPFWIDYSTWPDKN